MRPALGVRDRGGAAAEDASGAPHHADRARSGPRTACGSRDRDCNDTALLLADSVEQRGADHQHDSDGLDDGDGEDLALSTLDAELAAERLAVATARLVQREAAARLLRRIDQAVVRFATDLGRPDEAVQPQTLPTRA
jgi:hypothetical protein